jgi:N,N'-diacetyllegionaminate synthase
MRDRFIYAETAFHHEGDQNFLLQLIDAAVKANANGIKFQVLVDLNELIAKTNPAYETLKPYVFSVQQWRQIFQYARQKGLALVIMPLDKDSFILVEEFKSDIRYLELHSISYHDIAVKERIKKSGIELILGAGGRTKEEIKNALSYFGKQLSVLMTGFQSFPSKMEDIQISRIKLLREMFPSLAIGYADHSSFNDPWGVDSNTLAFSLGASVFEKHLTTQEGVKRVDFESAVGPDKFSLIREKLDSLHNILYAYPDPFEMTPAEVNYRNRQKMAVATRDLKAGEKVSEKDLALKMVGRFDGFATLEALVGKIIKNDVLSETIIKPEDVAH